MTVEFAEKAKKEFLKLDRPIQKQIQNFIVKLQGMKNPRSSGKALVRNLAGRWRYRVGDYRLVWRNRGRENSCNSFAYRPSKRSLQIAKRSSKLEAVFSSRIKHTQKKSAAFRRALFWAFYVLEHVPQAHIPKHFSRTKLKL